MPAEAPHSPFIDYSNDLQQVHSEAGLSMPKGRTPFIRESLAADFLTSNRPSTVLLDIGVDQLPAVCGLNVAIARFDEIAQSSDDSLLPRFQAAVEFRDNYTDQYTEVRRELVRDKIGFRLQIIDDLIHRSRSRGDVDRVQELERLHYSLQHGFNFDGLRFEYGNPRDNIADEVPSCVNGLVGTVREAALAYEADPYTEIIGLYPYLKSSVSAKLGLQPAHMGQIVKGITVKVHDREDHDEIKLLVDGVLADNYLPDILGIDWMPYMAIGVLEYARSQGIQRVIINTGNSGSHESVNAFQYFIATKYLGLQPGRDFTFDVDPDTGNHVFRLKSHNMKRAVDDFPYTHHLEKAPMPEEIVNALAAHSIYKGESYLETWWAWMTHVHNRRDAWRPKLRAKFPYAEQRHTTMKPAWNLGRGPMVGIELDVASVLADLHQQYL